LLSTSVFFMCRKLRTGMSEAALREIKVPIILIELVIL
jgi:hypothetical protein